MYKLYRKMDTREYNDILRDGLVINKDSGLCPKKCLSESLTSVYRLNPYMKTSNPLIVEFTCNDRLKNEINNATHLVKNKPYNTYGLYDNYTKHNGKSIKYFCHNKYINLFNYEIDDNDLNIINYNINNLRILKDEDYFSTLINNHLSLEQFTPTHNYTMKNNEFLIQVPGDFAVLLLSYKKLPNGGLNKYIKKRFVSKDIDLLNNLNNDIFPATLVIKLKCGDISLSFFNEHAINGFFSITSNLLDKFNKVIEDVRLVKYEFDKGIYKGASNKLNLNVSLKDILFNNILNNIDYCNEQITLNDMLYLLNKSNITNYFYDILNENNDYFFDADEMHDKNHAERVTLYSLIISEINNIDYESKLNLIKASYFHDIGKCDNKINDLNHGFKAIDILYKLNIECSNIEKFLIEAHDVEYNDNFTVNNLLMKYKIVDKDKVLYLLTILKDADALDRSRFSVFYNGHNSLNKNYLKNTSSFNLIYLSEYIAKAFYDNKSIIQRNRFITKL